MTERTIKIMVTLILVLNGLNLAYANVNEVIKSGTSYSNKYMSSGVDQNSLTYNYSTTNSEHFTLHYTLSGTDAVTTSFRDSTLSILEQMWSFQVSETGFSPPPGSGDGKVHVYLKDMITPYGLVYGQTVPLNQYGGTDVEAYIEIDNDFLNQGYTARGLNGLRVTIAHEFFHAIQMGYRYSPQYHYFYEWGSTWMEDYAFPEINDYIYYINDFFETPEASIRSAMGNIEYAHCLLFQTIELNSGSIAIVNILENFKEIDGDPFQCIKNAVVQDGYSVDELAMDYLIYCMFTGERSVADFGFQDASIMPEIELSTGNVSDLNWQTNLGEWGIFGGYLNGGVQGQAGVTVSSPYDHSFFTAVFNQQSIDFSFNDDNNLLYGDKAVAGVINLSDAENEIEMFAAPEREGLPTSITLKTGYPNPFNSTIRWNYLLDKPGKIDMFIVNVLGQEILHSTFTSGQKRNGSIFWDGKDKSGMACPSGFYILNLNAGNEHVSSKVLKIK